MGGGKMLQDKAEKPCMVAAVQIMVLHNSALGWRKDFLHWSRSACVCVYTTWISVSIATTQTFASSIDQNNGGEKMQLEKLNERNHGMG